MEGRSGRATQGPARRRKLDNGRPAARERDAEEAAAARRAGKPSAAASTSRIDKQLDRPSTSSASPLRSWPDPEEYQAALDEHADEWREQVDNAAEVADEHGRRP